MTDQGIWGDRANQEPAKLSKPLIKKKRVSGENV
jgi:hypothetical protein